MVKSYWFFVHCALFFFEFLNKTNMLIYTKNLHDDDM